MLSKSDYVARLETDLGVVRKELFYALATGAKLQAALRGDACNLVIEELYEAARIGDVDVAKWPAFIRERVEG